MSFTPTTTSHLPEYKFKDRGTILISPRLAAEIISLHKACGRDEWSGILIFEPIVEELVDCSKYVARAIAVYPMHFGNATYTEYGVGTEILDLYEKFPQADPANGTPTYKLAQIHSHHYMSTFFSGTDDQELRDNASKYEYYLSLIVNIDGKYAAKIAFEAEMPQDVKMKDRVIPQPPKQILAMFDLDVQMEHEAWFQDKVDDLKVEHKKPVTHMPYRGPNHDDGEYWDFHNRQNQSKTETRPLGFDFGGKGNGKKEEEKVKKESQPETKTIGKVTLNEGQVKNALPYLFLEDDTEAADTTFFWLFERHPLKDGTEYQINLYISRLKSRLEPWLEKHFGAEILASNGMIEEYILRRTLELVRLYTVDSKIAIAIYDFLEDYVERNYAVEDIRSITSKPNYD
jgi:hypothetical protein